MKDLPSALRGLAKQMLEAADALEKKTATETLRVPEVARRLGLASSTVQRWCRLGRLGKKVGRDYLIAPHELAAYRAELKAERAAGKRGG